MCRATILDLEEQIKNHFSTETTIETKYDNGKRLWIRNPINNFLYYCNTPDKKTEVLVESTASYIFDVWMMFVKKRGYVSFMQTHDSVLINVPKYGEPQAHIALNEAIQNINNKFDLNVILEIDVKFGETYADV